MTSFIQLSLDSRGCAMEPWAIPALGRAGAARGPQHRLEGMWDQPHGGDGPQGVLATSGDTEVTLPRLFPGAVSVQADPVPSALPLPSAPVPLAGPNPF